MKLGRNGSGALSVEPETALLARPRLARDVRVHEPIEDNSPWVVQRGAQQYIRVGADMVRLMRSMDGVHDHTGLAETLGPPWTAPEVSRAVENLRQMRLLESTQPRARTGTWLRFVPPMTVQFTVFRPERILAKLAPLLAMLTNRVAAVLATSIAMGGLLALALQASVLNQAVGQPLSIVILLSVMCASIVTTALHEIGHGAVLTHHGGRPNRMGVMLFYLTPAFFCDVSDGWRLPRKEQRVQVALAGVIVQMVIAGAAAITSVAIGTTAGSGVRNGLLVFAVSTYTAGVLNLLPFVKLDGYIALMTHLDISHLRDRTMTDARRYLAKVLFGGRYTRELPQLRWSVPFGLACMTFPLYLLGLGFTLWLDLLQGMGMIGASVVFIAVFYLAYRAWIGGRLLVREARAGGAPMWRIGSATLLTAVGLGMLLTFVTVPYTVTGGFVHEDSKTMLVVSGSADRASIKAGSTVSLFRRGAVTRAVIGSAVVGHGPAKEATAPLSAFVPVREGDAVPVPAIVFPLITQAAPGEHVGMARVVVGSRSLGEWLYLTYVAPVRR